MTRIVAAPGPGQWDLDRSHYPEGTTPIAQWLMESCMVAGTRRVFAEIGVPAESLRAQFVDGFMYTRLHPLIGPDKEPRRLPPPLVLKLASRLHPAFRLRTRRATETLSTNPSAAVARRWSDELRPALQLRNRAFQDVDLAALTDEGLRAHITALLDHLRETTELHFWLHGHDLGPIARYLHSALAWGIDAGDALAALAGASPSTTAPMATLVALRAELQRHGAEPATIEEIREVSAAAAGLLDDYLGERGCLVVTGYDLTAKTLGELPGLVLDSIRTAKVSAESEQDSRCESLRERVPEAERPVFDERLAQARTVMDMRDDNGPLTFEWPMGLLRLALLEAGRRLVAQGRLHAADHALELTPAEARDPFGPEGPAADVVASRVARRHEQVRLDPPVQLGPPEPSPPLDVLPGPLAEMVAVVQTALEHLDMAGSERVDPLSGSGIGSSPYTGRARVADSPEEAIERLEPGDVLIVRATSPAFNTVLGIAGAVVTTHGGPLSHAAVIAREFGIPAVIGAVGARDLPDGAIVEVDPVAGRVRLVSARPV